MKRGRPADIPSKDLELILLKYKEFISDENNNKVVSKHSEIWNQISDEIFEEFKIRRSAIALYTHVVCRKPFSNNNSNANIDNVSMYVK